MAARAEHFGLPATEDEYRVRVWPRRRFHLFGRWGWTVNVDYLSAWEESGDQALLVSRQLWFDTQNEAASFGVDFCGENNDEWGEGLPLVVHVGHETVIDERVNA